MEVEGLTDGLLERERELAALEGLIDDAREGRGRVVLIEGPAGISAARRACSPPPASAARAA